MKEFVVAASFFVPWLATLLDTYLGFVVSAVLCVVHFQSYRFARFVKMLDNNSKKPTPHNKCTSASQPT